MLHRPILKPPPLHAPDDLFLQTYLVHSDFNPPNLWRFKEKTIQIKPVLITNMLRVLINAAIVGEGIIYLSEYVVKEPLTRHQLIPLLPEQWCEPVIHSVIYPRQAVIPSKTRVFVDFIKSIPF